MISPVYDFNVSYGYPVRYERRWLMDGEIGQAATPLPITLGTADSLDLISVEPLYGYFFLRKSWQFPYQNAIWAYHAPTGRLTLVYKGADLRQVQTAGDGWLVLHFADGTTEAQHWGTGRVIWHDDLTSIGETWGYGDRAVYRAKGDNLRVVAALPADSADWVGLLLPTANPDEVLAVMNAWSMFRLVSAHGFGACVLIPHQSGDLQLTPDGRYILYQTANATTGKQEIYGVSIAAGLCAPPFRIFETTDQTIGPIRSTRDGDNLIFYTETTFYRYHIPTRTVFSLGYAADVMGNWTVQGDWLVFSRLTSGSEIPVYSVNIFTEERVTLFEGSPIVMGYPTWANYQDKYVLIFENKSLYRITADGTDKHLLAENVERFGAEYFGFWDNHWYYNHIYVVSDVALDANGIFHIITIEGEEIYQFRGYVAGTPYVFEMDGEWWMYMGTYAEGMYYNMSRPDLPPTALPQSAFSGAYHFPEARYPLAAWGIGFGVASVMAVGGLIYGRKFGMGIIAAGGVLGRLGPRR